MACPEIAWSRSLASVGPIDLVEVDLAADARREAVAITWLDSSERALFERFRGVRARREFALCRAALRHHLCRRLDCSNQQLAFGTLPHGKPFAIVKGKGVSHGFNVSHGAAHGLIAFSGRASLGVDLEERLPRRDFDGMGARVFGASEREALATTDGLDKMNLFYRLWTLKEALVKALGTGFSCDPTAFEVPLGMLHGARAGTIHLPREGAMSWRLADLGEARFMAAVAYELGI